MFEYINYGGLSVIVFILIISLIANGKKKELSWLTKALFGMLVVLLFEGYYQSYTAGKNIKDFNRGNITLKCISGAGVYNTATEYRVSKSDGWSIDKNYFIKDSFMIEASKCEKW